VAVAAGLVPLALGTDTAGSGRVPAALCGVVGYKPAPGWCSNVGVVPACASYDCISLFTTSVDDAIAAANVITGEQEHTAASDGRPIAVPDDASLEFDDDAEAEAAWRSVVDTIDRPARPISLDDFFAAGSLLYQGALLAERYAAVGAFIEEHPDDVWPLTRRIILDGARYTAQQVARDQTRVAELRDRIAPLWNQVDALVVPTVPTTFTLAQVTADPNGCNQRLGRYCHFVNLLGLAAIAVPSAVTPSGRPTGVTVVGPAHHGPRLVTIARELGSPSRHK
jgi:allophanate hydrolase